MTNDWAAVDGTTHAKARCQYEKLRDKVAEVFDGNVSPPDTPLWDSSAAKQLSEHKEIMLLRQKLQINNNRPGVPPAVITPEHTPTTATSTIGHNQRSSVATKLNLTNSKRVKTHNDTANLGKDGLDGYVVLPQLTKVWMIPLELNGKRPGSDFAICKKFYRKGIRCDHGQTCNRSHKHLKDLPLNKAQIL
ncbi:hypothetical protein HJC23_004771 [Cyclotella cryptica]|uniref:C3H1-type domain-containing protein n=1 Tax=Cyclotella cryptica TaxID=29204 RepID=A0ABD3PBZ2_9STRA